MNHRLASAGALLLIGCGFACSSNQGDKLVDGPVAEESRPTRYVRSSVSKLVLEIDSVPGFSPNAAAQSDLISQLLEVLDKPGGIEAQLEEGLQSRGNDHAWTDSELFDLAEQTFDLEVSDSAIKIHALFVDGHSARDSNQGRILGLAWSNKHLVMFKQTIRSLCAGSLTPVILRDQLCQSAEFSVWIHEVGHVLGLVNTGIPMVNNHQDPDHGAHDVNENCVMYWAYEGEALIDTLRDRLVAGNDSPLAFDEACRADIAALRSGQ